MSNGRWCSLGIKNDFLGKSLQAAVWGGVWEVYGKDVPAITIALWSFLPGIPYTSTCPFLCWLAQAMLFVQEKCNSIASSDTWFVHLPFLDE